MDPRQIRDILKQFSELQRRQVRYRQGVVTDDSPLSVALGGSDVSYTGVAALPDTYTIGDPVAVLMFDRDLLVLGVVNGAGGGGGSSDGAPHTIQDEGSPLTQRSVLDFAGSGVTAADAGGKTVVTIPGAATPKYQTVQDEGSGLTQRAALDFAGAGVTATDDSGGDRTVVTIPGMSAADVRAILASLDAGVDIIAWEKVGTSDDLATIYTVVTGGSAYATVDSDAFAVVYTDIDDDTAWTLVRAGTGAGPIVSTDPSVFLGGPAGQAMGRTLDDRIYYRPGEAAREDSRTSFQVTGYERYANLNAEGPDMAVVKCLSSGDMLLVGKGAVEFTPYPASESGVGLQTWEIREWVSATDTFNVIATVTTSLSGNATGHYIRVKQVGNVLTMEQWSSSPPTTGGSPVESSSYTLTGSMATKYGTGVTGKGGMLFNVAQATYDNYLRESVTPTEARELWVSVTDELGVTTAKLLLDDEGASDFGHVIRDEGTALTYRPALDFVGGGVTATDDAANDKTIVTIPTPKYQTVQDEGSGLTQRDVIDFQGAGVTAADTGGKTVVTIPAGGHTIQEEGSALTARTYLDFVGAGVTATDDAANDKTIVTISSGGGGSAIPSEYQQLFASSGALTDYTLLAGAGATPAVSGGLLTASTAGYMTLALTSGPTTVDATHIIRIRTPTTFAATNFEGSLILKYIDSSNYLLVNPWRSSSSSGFDIYKNDAGAFTSLLAVGAITAFATDEDFWLIVTMTRNRLRAALSYTDPILSGLDLLAGGTVKLTGANATKYGSGVTGLGGLRLNTNQATAGIDEHRILLPGVA